MRLPEAATRLLAVVLMALAPLPVAAALVSDALAARVAGWQRMIDPLMPALLLLVLMVVAWALVLAVFGGLLLRRQRVLALGWLLAVLVNSLAVRVLKGAIGRERPTGAAELVTSGASFPSGHAAGALLVYGLLLWIVLPLVARRRWRAVLAVAGGVLIGAIVVSRVLLRVHFVSDVVGGLLLAGFTLLLATGLLRPWRPGDGVEWERPWPR